MITRGRSFHILDNEENMVKYTELTNWMKKYLDDDASNITMQLCEDALYFRWDTEHTDMVRIERL